MNTSTPWAEGLPARVKGWPIERLALVHLLRVTLGAELRPDLRARCATVLKPSLMQEVRRHRVGAYLANRLPAETIALFASEFGRGLRRIKQQTQLAALAQTAGLVHLCKRFEQEGLKVMTLKGPVLAQDLYGTQGVRHAGDIDFSIESASIQKVDQLLCENGYRRTCPPGDMSPLRWKKYAEVWRDCEYENQENRLLVETMWRLANNQSLQARLERGKPEPQVIGGHLIQSVPRDVHGVYLLVHGASHGWYRLFWLVDIALLMKSEKVDWKQMRTLAEETGVDRHFWQGLHLAHDLLGVAWPEGLGAVYRDEALEKNLEDAYWQLELSLREYKVGASHYRKSQYARRLTPDAGRQWRELSKRWINPENWEQWPLSDRWFALYYMVWPGLWIWRQVAKRLRAKPSGKGIKRTDSSEAKKKLTECPGKDTGEEKF